MARPSTEERTPEHLRFPLEPLLALLDARTPDDPADTGYKFAARLGVNTARSGAAYQAFERGWCDQWQADTWALRAKLMPWDVWPAWLAAGLHPLDALYPLEAWWRPAWLALDVPRERAESVAA